MQAERGDESVPVKYMHPFPGCPCEALDAKLDRQPVKGPFKGQLNDGVKDQKDTEWLS